MSTNSGETADQSFPRATRLLTKADYSSVFGRAKPYRNQHFTVLVKEGSEHVSRLGMVVAKKKCRRAVDRHRIKRLIRESFRHRRNTLPLVDIVVIAQPKASLATNEELFRSLSWFWDKLSRNAKGKKR